MVSMQLSMLSTIVEFNIMVKTFLYVVRVLIDFYIFLPVRCAMRETL